MQTLVSPVHNLPSLYPLHFEEIIFTLVYIMYHAHEGSVTCPNPASCSAMYQTRYIFACLNLQLLVSLGKNS